MLPLERTFTLLAAVMMRRVRGLRSAAAPRGAFLIAGPVTTVPAMSAVWGVVTRRVFALYLGVLLVGAVVLGWLTNLVLG